MDGHGAVSALPCDTEYLYRWAPLIGIYGGTIDVFRTMSAQYVLGLGRW